MHTPLYTSLLHPNGEMMSLAHPFVRDIILILILKNINIVTKPEFFEGRKEAEYLRVILDNATLRLALAIFAVVRN